MLLRGLGGWVAGLGGRCCWSCFRLFVVALSQQSIVLTFSLYSSHPLEVKNRMGPSVASVVAGWMGLGQPVAMLRLGVPLARTVLGTNGGWVIVWCGRPRAYLRSVTQCLNKVGPQ